MLLINNKRYTIMENTRTVDAIMTKNVISITPETPYAEIKDLFDKNHFHHLPVLDDKKQLMGIISKEDLYKALFLISLHTKHPDYSHLKYGYISASDLMTKYPVFLEPDDMIDLAADIFLSNKLHALPILEDGDLIGIVTTHDMMQYAFTEMRSAV